MKQGTDEIDAELLTIHDELESNFLFAFCQRFLHLQLLYQFCITVLQDTTLALDFRITVLEENGGNDGNSTVAELEERVEELEGSVDGLETRLLTAESEITGTFSSEPETNADDYQTFNFHN